MFTCSGSMNEVFVRDRLCIFTFNLLYSLRVTRLHKVQVWV